MFIKKLLTNKEFHLLKPNYIKRRIKKLHRTATSKDLVEGFWDLVHKKQIDGNEVLYWWSVPGMHERWNSKISGNPNLNRFQYVSKKYFQRSCPSTALTLGCGTGHREREWAKYYRFQSHDGIDISSVSIKIAKDTAKEEHIQQLHYDIGDLNCLKLSPNSYDVIFAEQSLHHVKNLEDLLNQVKNTLRPGGLFIVDEFIGSTRFQWPDRQLEIINGTLLLLSPELRFRGSNIKHEKRSVSRPTIQQMMDTDPSEAVRSAEIPDLIKRVS